MILCEQLGLYENTTIYIADSYYHASTIASKASIVEARINFKLVKSYEEAINATLLELPAHVFIHWDVGFGTQPRLKKFKKANYGHKISVFEEGIGTYRQDVYPPLKRTIFKILGLPVNVGGSRYVDDIYVFDREKYINQAYARPDNVIQINTRLDEAMASQAGTFSYLFSSEDFLSSLQSSSNDTCEIYLSNWSFHESDIHGRFSENVTKVLKLHPYCDANFESDEILVAPKSLPAELLILTASNTFRSVTVYHNASSVHLYITCPNVSFVNTA